MSLRFVGILNKFRLVLFVAVLCFFWFTTSVQASNYYVATNGSDSNSGTLSAPWQTIQKAVQTVFAGDTIYVRGGEYDGITNGWRFKNSGTQSKPITFSNYPGEQIVLKITTADRNDHEIFSCPSYIKDHPTWQSPKADYIHIVGSDVSPRLLTNGVESKKGIVMRGMVAEQSSGIIASDCDYWEVAGIDFIDVSNGIFAFKDNWGTMTEHSTDHWYVHNNRVYGYYRESGMQFNGDDNRIENNEIYKVTGRVDTPYGCQLLNFLGDHNIVRGNTLSRSGSLSECTGILFEWDLADGNIVEQNRIFDVTRGMDIEGGDNNIIRNNVIYTTGTPDPYSGGIEVKSYDNTVKTDWPCQETLGSAQALLPANNSSHPDYQYYYNPRNCHSYGNQIYNNTIHGFTEGIRIYQLVGENTVIRNNVFSGFTRGSICFYNSSNGTCKSLPVEITEDHNATQGNFGFGNIGNYDFKLTASSPLINTGYNLSSFVPNDKDGITRPQGGGYDIGAYEYVGGGTPKPGDLNGDNSVDIIDIGILIDNYNKIPIQNIKADLNNDGVVNIIDTGIIIDNYGK